MVSASLGFHVLGAGSIGLLFTHHLRQAAHPVTLLVRDERAVSAHIACPAYRRSPDHHQNALAVQLQHLIMLEMKAMNCTTEDHFLGECSNTCSIIIMTQCGNTMAASHAVMRHSCCSMLGSPKLHELES